MQRKIAAAVTSLLVCVTAATALSVCGVSGEGRQPLSAPMLSASAADAEVVETGSLGENVTYTLYSDGLLDVTGSGEMDASIAQQIKNKNQILSLNIGGGVTSVAAGIFNNCQNLKKIVVGDSVKSLGTKLFEQCQSVESITIPFAGTSLENAEGDENVRIAAILFGAHFTGGYSISGNYVPTVLKEITITNGTKLGTNALKGFSYLTTVTLPDSMKEIGASAFRECTRLTKLNCCEAFDTIGSYAFSGCSSFQDMSFALNAKNIADYAFSNCTGLTEVVLTDRVETMGLHLFSNCFNITKVTMPYAGTSLENAEGDENVHIAAILFCEYFSGGLSINGNYVPTVLKELTITNGTQLGSKALNSFSMLAIVTLPDSMTVIGDSAFQNCSALKKVNCAEQLDSIGTAAFANCGSLTDISFASNAKAIGTQAFAECNKLTTAVFTEDVESLGTNIFDKCTKMESVTLPYAGTSLENSESDEPVPVAKILFGGYVTDFVNVHGSRVPKTLKNLTISGGSIVPDNAFKDMSMLECITLSDEITEIGASAFEGCKGVVNFVIPASVETIGDNAFANCAGNVSILGNADSAIAEYAEEKKLPFHAVSLEFEGAELVLEDSFRLILRVSGWEGAEQYDLTGVPVNVTLANGRTVYAVVQNVNGQNVIYVDVAAKDYMNKVVISMLDLSYEYSLAAYFEKCRLVYPELTDLAVAAENYCKAAAYYFGTSDEKVTFEWTDAEEANLVKDGGAFYTALQDNINYHGYSLLLSAQTFVRLYYGNADAFYDFGGFSPLEFDQADVFREDRDVPENTIYAPTVMNFIYTVLHSETASPSLVEVCKALYQYSAASRAAVMN